MRKSVIVIGKCLWTWPQSSWLWMKYTCNMRMPSMVWTTSSWPPATDARGANVHHAPPCPMSRCPNSMAGRKLHGHVWAYSDAYDAEGVLEESKVLVPLAARQAGAVRGKHIASHGWHGATCQSNRPPHLVHQCNQIWGQHMPQWVGGDLGLFPIQPVPMQSCRCRSSCSHMPAQPKHMQQSLQPLLLRKQHPQLGSAGPRLHQGRLRSKPIHK